MPKYFEALENLYKEYLILSEQITRAIKDEAFEELSDMVERKGKILEGVLRQEGIVELDEAQRARTLELRGEIFALEEANLVKMEALKEDIRTRLISTNKVANLQNAYGFKPGTGEIFDTSE